MEALQRPRERRLLASSGTIRHFPCSWENMSPDSQPDQKSAPEPPSWSVPSARLRPYRRLCRLTRTTKFTC